MDLLTAPPEELAGLLADARDRAVVLDAACSYRSQYGGPAEPSAYELLTGLGAPVAGSSATTAWVDA